MHTLISLLATVMCPILHPSNKVLHSSNHSHLGFLDVPRTKNAKTFYFKAKAFFSIRNSSQTEQRQASKWPDVITLLKSCMFLLNDCTKYQCRSTINMLDIDIVIWYCWAIKQLNYLHSWVWPWSSSWQESITTHCLFS